MIAHVEVTEACQERCRHCYNFQRSVSYKPREITWDNLNHTIEELIKNKVLHVIITGGEPILALEKTCYLARRCTEAGMSISLNSNLYGATPEVAKQLKEAGIYHCLSTLFSHKPEVHDFMASTSGAHAKILQGIQNMIEAGIRVSVNAIVSEHNKDDVFKTGKLLKSIGVKKFIANRCIPSQDNDESLQNEFLMDEEGVRKLNSDLKRVRDELGMEIKACRPTPECFFDDPDGDDYPFTHRGCNAGREQIVLNVDGNAQACMHESKNYGNIHEIGIQGVWKNMEPWRTDEYIPDECKDCPRFPTCQGGCRMVALYFTGKMNGCDNLRKGNPVLPKKEESPNQINFRSEDGFYVFRTRGAAFTYIDKY